MQRTRVLVVEDEADIRNGLAEIFAEEGYSVSVASNGAEGLDRARAHAPHLIVLDLMMPVMDGFTFLEHQRNDGAIDAIPVIVLTARRQVSVGACEIIYKPFDIERLLAAVRRCADPSAHAPDTGPDAASP